MKRSALQRKTPLQAHTPLKRTPMKHHRSKQARSKDFSSLVRATVYNRSNHICEMCGMRSIAHLHHTNYRSHGGTGELSNCLGVCVVCHENIHAHRVLRELAVQKAKELAEAR